MRTTRKLALAVVVLFVPVAAFSADWPQWRGPDRTGVSQEKGLLKAWPKGGPTLLWTFKDAGTGYSGTSIVGDLLYTMGARKGEEYLIAVDVKNGKELWSKKIGPIYPPTQWTDGPSASPTVDKELIFALTSNGEVACFDLKGEKKWGIDLQKTMKARVNPIFAKADSQGWGFCWSPLVDGDNLILTPGGPEGLFAAVKKTTGEVVWRSKAATDQCTYASPIVADIKGVRQYIAVVQDGCVGVDAKTGDLLWRYKRRVPFGDIVGVTPIFHDDSVFITGKGGCDLVGIAAEGKTFTAKLKKASREMQNMHGGVVLVDKFLYGADSERSWKALPFADPSAPAWDSERDGVGAGAVTAADGMLYVVSEKDGVVALLEATSAKYSEKGTFALPEVSKVRPKSGKVWTPPVIANGRLYLRDQELIFCYEVKK